MSTRRDALMSLMAPAMAGGAAAGSPPPTGAVATAGLFTELKGQTFPAGVQAVQTCGYAAPGSGAALYMATTGQGEVPFRTRTADGRWFELAETLITPQMFGARGNGRVDDTEALQAWLDYLKANLAWGPRGRANLGRGRLPAGIYLVTRSLDLTSDGAPVGGRSIVGDDEQNTVILGELVEPFPVLDATNAYGLHLEGFQIRCSKASKATCCLLLAQDRDNAFITYNNSLERVRLALDYDAPNGVAALVVQNSDLLKLSNIKAQGPIGLSLGWRLPVKHAGIARGGGRDSIVLDASASGEDGAYVGHPIRLVAGAGAGGPRQAIDPISTPAIGRIVAYDGASRTARVDRPWAAQPDASTAFELYAIASKFRTPQSHDDATHYALNNSCTLLGKTPVVLTGNPGSVDLGDSYLAGERGLGADACGVLIAPSHEDDARLGPLCLFGRNFRTENQSGTTPFYAIKNASRQPVSIDLQGNPVAGPFNPAAPSAVFADVGGIGFRDVHVQGKTGEDGVRMFAVSGAIRTFRGSMHCVFPGEVKGGIGRFDFDWQVSSYDRNWLPFVLSTVRHAADTGLGPVLPVGATVQVPGLSGGAWAAQGFTLGCAHTSIAYPGGNRPATVAAWTIPAGVLAFADPVVRSLRTEIALDCAANGVFAIYLRQGAKRLPLAQGLPLAAGQRGLVRLALQNGNDGARTAGEVRLSKTVVAELEEATGAFAGFDAAQTFTLEIDVASASPDPLGFGVSWFRVD